MPVNSKSPLRRDRLLTRAWTIDYIGTNTREFDKYYKKYFPTVNLGGKTFYRQRDIDAWENAVNQRVLDTVGLEW